MQEEKKYITMRINLSDINYNKYMELKTDFGISINSIISFVLLKGLERLKKLETTEEYKTLNTKSLVFKISDHNIKSFSKLLEGCTHYLIVKCIEITYQMLYLEDFTNNIRRVKK